MLSVILRVEEFQFCSSREKGLLTIKCQWRCVFISHEQSKKTHEQAKLPKETCVESLVAVLRLQLLNRTRTQPCLIARDEQACTAWGRLLANTRRGSWSNSPLRDFPLFEHKSLDLPTMTKKKLPLPTKIPPSRAKRPSIPSCTDLTHTLHPSPFSLRPSSPAQ